MSEIPRERAPARAELSRSETEKRASHPAAAPARMPGVSVSGEILITKFNGHAPKTRALARHAALALAQRRLTRWR